MKLFTMVSAAVLLLSATAMADNVNRGYHITGQLNTTGTNGWMTQQVLYLPDGVSVVSVSASANGKNTYLDCVFSDPSGAVHKQTHTLLCNIRTPNLALPWHMTATIVNDNPGPVMYDLEVVSKG